MLLDRDLSIGFRELANFWTIGRSRSWGTSLFDKVYGEEPNAESAVWACSAMMAWRAFALRFHF